MPKVKDADIKSISTTKRDFYSALKKVSHRLDKPKSSSPPPPAPAATYHQAVLGLV